MKTKLMITPAEQRQKAKQAKAKSTFDYALLGLGIQKTAVLTEDKKNDELTLSIVK